MNDFVGYEFESLIVSGTVQVLSPDKYEALEASSGALEALLTLEGGDIRFTYSNISPTDTIGHLLKDGGTFILRGRRQIAHFKCIKAYANDARISITYGRE